MRDIIESIEHEYRRFKSLAEGTFDQLSGDQLAHIPAAEGNSVAILVWHIAGNLKSRFTDFLKRCTGHSRTRAPTLDRSCFSARLSGARSGGR